MRCESCEMLAVNGVPTHEQGCPDAWRGRTVACFECGCDFVPEHRGQVVCEGCTEDREFGDDSKDPAGGDDGYDSDLE